MERERLLELIRGGENNRTEFKTAIMLRDTEEVAGQLVAFANRNGGQILFGVKNDGTIEGKSIDADEEVTRVSNVAKNNCSPEVEFSFDYTKLDEGDVLVIDVKRRRRAPHAVVDRKHHEIAGRTYYIRAANGKRLVEDGELEWLFKNAEDPEFSSRHKVSVVYNRKTLGIPFLNMSGLSFQLLPFIQVSEQDRDYILGDETNRVPNFIIELLPYALLHHFSWVFGNSWLVRFVRSKGETRIHSEPVPINKGEIRLADIPPLQNPRIISNLSSKPWDVFQKQSSKMSVPSGTSITIQVEPSEVGTSSKLRIAKDGAFTFTIAFQFSSWNVGLPYAHPRRAQYQGLHRPHEMVSKVDAEIATMNVECFFRADFAFPESPDPDFSEHHKFARLIDDLLRTEWDFDRFLESLPDSKLYVIEDKLDEVLTRLDCQKK